MDDDDETEADEDPDEDDNNVGDEMLQQLNRPNIRRVRTAYINRYF